MSVGEEGIERTRDMNGSPRARICAMAEEVRMGEPE